MLRGEIGLVDLDPWQPRRMAGEEPEKHASPLRALMADSDGSRYRSFESLADAQADPLGAVIREGDDGGQIYLAVPADVVGCAEGDLEELLIDLDFIAWPGNDQSSRRVVFEAASAGTDVLGGMGGGSVDRAIWVHPDFEARGIADEIRAVIRGETRRLSHDALHGKRRRRSAPRRNR